MNEPLKFKIGEFSKICQVTVKTLRYYEEIGLLSPVDIDSWTGYRYYTLDQLHRMNRIVSLKQLGFSLDEIALILEQTDAMPNDAQLAAKLNETRLQQKKLKERVLELNRLKNNLHKQKDVMKKVSIISLPSRIYATHRQKIDSYQDLFNLCVNVIGPEMHRLGCECPEPQYCFTIEYQKEYGKDIDIEYYEAVAQRGEDSDIIKFVELPEVKQALCIGHKGAYEKLPETFADIFDYIQNHGYRIIDHPRFCYIDGIWNKDSVQDWYTEIQIPVELA